jgi:rSAM/selenodomain-associated transferase 1
MSMESSRRKVPVTLANPERIVGLLAKQPTPGLVKTRLAAETSPEWAARVAHAFLTDTVNHLAHIEARRILVFAPAEARVFFSHLGGSRFILSSQSEGDLGKRMEAFFRDAFQDGPAKAVLLGVDSPTLPLSYLERAFDHLDRADLVLGPATDGGYYLVGCSGRVPPIFENLDWSHADVLGSAISKLHDPSFRLALLPPWYDVDTLNDWRMLRGHLAAVRRAGMDPRVPNTEKLAMESTW